MKLQSELVHKPIPRLENCWPMLLLFSRVRLFMTPWTRAGQALLSSTASRSLVKLMLVASRTLSNHLVLCRPLLLVPSIFPNIRGFSRESSFLMRWPKYWRLSFRICPSSEHSGLISLRMERFDLLAVHGTLKSLLQHHNSKASILWRSAFFLVQLSLPYITIGKTMALTIRTLVSKVMSLLFQMLSRFVIAFLPRSRRLLISWLLSPSAVIMEPKKVKSLTASISSPSICQEVMGPVAMIFVFLMSSFRPYFVHSSFTLIKRFFNSSSLSAIKVVSSAYLRLLRLVHRVPLLPNSHLILRLQLLTQKTDPNSNPMNTHWGLSPNEISRT
uniref:Uncharacterized protein n=1 Tax=Podarcis muralis TaxID=64176 RepID=A0A670IPF5_PODMU